MISIIIGHRGVGKTEFLKRVEGYYQERNLTARFIDLDEEVAKFSNKSIAQIFNEEGEAQFRNLELKVFNSLIERFKTQQEPVYLTVGAGFMGPLPNFARVIWLKRNSDKMGRIFLNRPRLNPELTPLAEYFARYREREVRFQSWYHEILWLSEGETKPNQAELALIGLSPAEAHGIVTLLPQHMESDRRLESLLSRAAQLGVEKIELRNDLLTDEQIKDVKKNKSFDWLISFRRHAGQKLDAYEVFDLEYDWALELGVCPFGEPPILSLHERAQGESVEAAARRLTQVQAKHYKLAIEINNLFELWQGHQWYLEDPKRRSFLPCSKDGRFSWYRLHVAKKMHLQFYRFDEGSCLDQPTLMDRLLAKEASSDYFAAVIGNPVQHSFTPTEQRDYFSSFKMPVYQMCLEENDFTALSLSILQRLGLRAAAVTSPFKRRAFELAQKLTKEAYEFKSANTLWWSDKKHEWCAANTDVIALEELKSKINLSKDIAVWGGGGLKAVLMKVFPKAIFFRARTGFSTPEAAQNFSPNTLVWAVGRAQQDTCLWPSANWRPQVVFDLNYTENSPGLEYAIKVGAKYVSGLEFFKLQAAAQRAFWSRCRVEEKAQILEGAP
jgi:shikimate 5-dehydrogenase/shikimate kinase